MFFGSKEAGQRRAVIYTLIENCRMHGVEPYTYLKDVLEKLPNCTNRDLDQLTPLNWKQTRQVITLQSDSNWDAGAPDTVVRLLLVRIY